jgi:uncharacterized repeat protein (TIGR03806 family)
VNVPFWSDEAEKERYLALPDGKQATVDAAGHLDLPNGAVLMKHFRLGDRLIETRLFMRHDDGVWAGYTYEWDDEERDATLVMGGKKKALEGDRAWLYPSGAQCLECHNEAAGHTLGLELRQLDRVVEYSDTGRRSPQLDTLQHMGLLDPAAPHATDPLPVPYGTEASAEIDRRARAWLHVNCAFCHRPSGPGRGNQDLRYDRSLAQTGLCNGTPTEGDLGISGAKLLVPGQPDQSVISLRIRATDDKRMPPLASLIHDQDGTTLIDAWIRSITACP